MALNYKSYARLEPRHNQRNLQAGFAANVYDPVWFLARQWQMGEHQGENASSPVWVDYTLTSHPIQSSDQRFDPTEIPAEAIVESEIDDWWTMGRRVRLGRRIDALGVLPDNEDTRALRFYHPAPPYEHFHGQYDGLRVWRQRADFGLADADFGADVPPDSAPDWVPQQLIYEQSEEKAFSTDQHKLLVQRHRGGRMDWYSVDAALAGEGPPSSTEDRQAIPTVLQYPGAPKSRWWEIEAADADFGSYSPDSAHTPTALLTDLIFSHSDDWFLFPVLAGAGHLVMMEKLIVHDAFDRVYSSEDTGADGQPIWQGLHPPSDWTLFQVDGVLSEEPAENAQKPVPEALLLWHVAELPLESLPLERVQFGLDEESNLLWAVERIIDGREAEPRETDAVDDQTNPKFNAGKPSGDARTPREYGYVAGQGIAPFWHPYIIPETDGDRWLERRRLLDFTRQNPTPMPSPQAETLQSDSKKIAPLAVPSNGIELERRWQLARDMHGHPVLWIQRQRRSLMAPPARRLRFDVMEPLNEE